MSGCLPKCQQFNYAVAVVTNVVKQQELKVSRRTISQNASLAVRDIYDAIVELVTNADDRYQVLKTKGTIEIEVTRKRGVSSILAVRDYADGMTSDVMDRKLGTIGNRVSGMEKGLAVRGTNSRGAKDIAALGKVTFESIGDDGKLHMCCITDTFEYQLYESREVTKNERRRLGIGEGTGTLVTLEFKSSYKTPIPRHEELVKKIALLVPLRDIIREQRTTIIVRALPRKLEHEVVPLLYQGKKCLSERFPIPNYLGMDAKLIIFRATQPFEYDASAGRYFRKGGILVKSRHAIHEATLFDRELDKDPCASRFYGRLTCESIDQIWNEFDERSANRQQVLPTNPFPILDPSRRGGLIRQHPFTEALYSKALSYLRPLVEEERRRDRAAKSEMESRQTRKHLNKLQKAANKFIEEYMEPDDDDTARTIDHPEKGSSFRIRGYALNPPFVKMVVGSSQNFRLSVITDAFPDIAAGDSVQIKCLTDEIRADRIIAQLECSPETDGILQAIWTGKALKKTSGTGIQAQVGPISAESMIEILGSESESYAHIKDFQFQRKRYQIRPDSRKRVNLLAPLNMAQSLGCQFIVETDNDDYHVPSSGRLVKKPKLGIAKATLTVAATRDNLESTKLRARLGEHIAETNIIAKPAEGAGIEIKLEDVSHGVQRYKWNKNVLEIAARHPSLSRYLGPKSERFSGQEEHRFQVLIAEIVADAVCSNLVRHNAQTNPADYDNADWDTYYFAFSELMDKFLPIAHKQIIPSP